MKQLYLAASLLLLLVAGQGCVTGIYHSVADSLRPPTLDEEVLAEQAPELRKKRIAGLTNPRFTTDEAMLAASELLLTADPFWSRFEELGWADEGFAYREQLTETGPAYSRYNIDHLMLTSGMGVPLTASPHFNPSLNRRLLLMAGIEDYPIPNTMPTYLEYATGDPHFVQLPNYGDADRGIPPQGETLRWNPDWFDAHLEPATLGAGLKAQILWAKRFLWMDPADLREEDDSTVDPIDDTGADTLEDVFDSIAEAEVTDADRYFGLQFAEMAANKIIALATQLTYETFEDRLIPLPENYEPLGWDDDPFIYFPHQVIERDLFESDDPDFDPDTLPLDVYVVADERSHLDDQAILLDGLLEFIEFSDPNRFTSVLPLFPGMGSVSGAARPIFTNRVPVLARRVAEAIVRNMLGMHWDKNAGSFVTYATATRKGKAVRSRDAGLALVALERFAAERWVSEELRKEVREIVRKQGTFLLEYQYKDGAYADMIDVSSGDAAEPAGFQLTSQMYAIRGLLVAYRITGDFRLRQAAWRTYLYLEKTLWAPAHNLYRVEDLVAMGQKHNVVTPLVLAATLGGLRELALETRDFRVVSRMMDFIDGMEKTGLLLSELQPTGENLSVEDWDFDDDGITKPQFAGGRFGLAPVFSSEVLVYIPSTGDIIPLDD
ncbi:MAG: hypothetical protein DHS20C21_23660 [Gemmatimonadota bacterium]|nr:MAG: hypothetical protein DHS20C21_23660 [Gemmatimonadota bacterium]